MENPIKMDDLGIPLFLETPKYPFWGDQTMTELSLKFDKVEW